jgi:hypothetical protein
MINSIRARLDRIASDAGSATRAGVGMMQDTIEENPVLSVAVAFGLGWFCKHAAPLTGKGDFDENGLFWLLGVPIPVLIVAYLIFN